MRRVVQLLCLTVVSLVVVAVSNAAPAQASGWVVPSYWWAYSGNSEADIYGEAYGHDYGCGLEDCADGSNLFIETYRAYGPYVEESEVNATITFSGTALSVSVSDTGLSFGFYQSSYSCTHGYWYSPYDYVTVDFGSGNICHTATWGWVSAMRLGVGGGVRIGGNWSVRTASDCTSMGGSGC